MKKIFILAFSLMSISLFSQTLPNYDFEEWNDYIIYKEPVNWSTPNFYTFLVDQKATVSKSNDAYTGSSSAKLETMNISGFNLPGVMTLAEISVSISDSSYSVSGGFFLQENIYKLTGWYKYNGVGEDQASILMYNFKNTPETGYDTIGYGYGFLDNTDTWSQFTVYMTNISNAVPDTFNVIIASSLAVGAQEGSVLFVDSLSIYTNTGIIDLWKPKTQLSVYPNPAISNITFESKTNISNGMITIYNNIGEKLAEKTFENNSTSININNLTPGVYTYTLREKNKILNSGTFIKN